MIAINHRGIYARAAANSRQGCRLMLWVGNTADNWTRGNGGGNQGVGGLWSLFAEVVQEMVVKWELQGVCALLLNKSLVTV